MAQGDFIQEEMLYPKDDPEEFIDWWIPEEEKCREDWEDDPKDFPEE